MRRGLLLGDVVVANCAEPPGDSGGHEARFMLVNFLFFAKIVDAIVAFAK